MLYLLTGPDRYLVETELRRIAWAADPDGLNTSRFERNSSISDVSTAVATGGFFGAGRVVVAEGILARFKGPAKARASDLEDFDALVESIAPGNTLILVDPDLHVVPVEIRKRVGSNAITFGGKAPRGSDLIEWTQAHVRDTGGVIDRYVAGKLLDRLFPGAWQQVNKNPAYDHPPELQRLVSELEKLVLHAGEREIGLADLEFLIPIGNEDSLFSLADAIVHGRANEAMKLLAGDENNDDAASRLLNQLISTAELAPIATSLRGDAQVQAIGKELQLSNPNRLAVIQGKFRGKDAEEFADVVIESDRRLKTGYTRTPWDQLLEILVRQENKKRGQG
jgi:DNA polymerase III delta subunit